MNGSNEMMITNAVSLTPATGDFVLRNTAMRYAQSTSEGRGLEELCTNVGREMRPAEQCVKLSLPTAHRSVAINSELPSLPTAHPNVAINSELQWAMEITPG